jgi:hypothetical protein
LSPAGARPKGKEVNTVNYAKPEVMLVSIASAEIQGLGKQINPNPDSSQTSVTVAAYEADE